MPEAPPIRPLSDYRFADAFETRFAKVYYLEFEQYVICELKAEYVPIVHFKETFRQISDTVK